MCSSCRCFRVSEMGVVVVNVSSSGRVCGLGEVVMGVSSGGRLSGVV